MSLFEELLPKLPAQLDSPFYDIQARRRYARSLAAEGRLELALPIFEAVMAHLQSRGKDDVMARQAMADLGDAYDRMGRTAVARALLDDAATTTTVPAERAFWELEVDDRWAFFLLEHGGLHPRGADIRRCHRSTGEAWRKFECRRSCMVGPCPHRVRNRRYPCRPRCR
jgi:hypothetical protein